MNVIQIRAGDYVDPKHAVIDSAALIVATAIQHLRRGDNVRLTGQGVRGVSSSFFNVVLRGVVAEVGRAELLNRFDVQTETETQSLIYKRSLEAIQAEQN